MITISKESLRRVLEKMYKIDDFHNGRYRLARFVYVGIGEGVELESIDLEEAVELLYKRLAED